MTLLPDCSVLAPRPSLTFDDEPRPQTNVEHRRRTSTDRFRMLNKFVDSTMRELKAAEIKVWMVLFRDTRNSIAATAQSDIARRSGINVRTVQRAIRKLEKRGLLTVVHQGSLLGGISKYRVIGKSNLSRPPAF